MSEHEFVTHSGEETIARGRELASRIKPPLLVLLTGELGAGKTTLAKGIISGLGAAREEDITSPTFTLVHSFCGNVKVFHVDLYRISDAHDFHTLGLEDLFDEPAIVLIEWPDRMRLRTDWPVLRIRLEHAGEDVRKISVAEVIPKNSASDQNVKPGKSPA
ncbi:MAG TPA: tRNA (adenosine(37)-N6)-threonylcarbamoyltransferase complex ATPase subunit type 1 TsaE [Candidatus Acidoferrales bacterium]|nr:tRNA (adenosine(37)-N6)-threonylcarbamoyltransferase complex ATPase subunit type 1 TsaE [Candidatus Acidoferrales bacterium]